MLFRKSLNTFIFIFWKEEYFKNGFTICFSCLVYCIELFILFWFPQNPWRGVCRCLPPPSPPASVLVEPRINGFSFRAAAGFKHLKVDEAIAHCRQSFVFSTFFSVFILKQTWKTWLTVISCWINLKNFQNNVCRCWTLLELANIALSFRKGGNPDLTTLLFVISISYVCEICGVSAAANVKGDLPKRKSLTYRRHLYNSTSERSKCTFISETKLCFNPLPFSSFKDQQQDLEKCFILFVYL